MDCMMRLMDLVLRGAEDYLGHLRNIFRRIHQAGLVVNASKCYLGKPEVCYLGGVIKPQVSKKEAIWSCPTPTPKMGLRSFLGLVAWYRRFIPDCF